MEKEVFIWWTMMSAITILNITVLIYSAILIRRSKSALSVQRHLLSSRLLILSAIYVAGCGFRAVLPRIDADRIVLIDHWLSNILLGRSVATLAEIAFAAQWALLFYVIGKYKTDKTIVYISYSLVPIIIIAEIFSWRSTLTTINFGHIIEESLWAFSAVLIMFCFIRLYLHTSATIKKLYAAAIICAVVYVCFMILVDIQMYYQRW